MIDMELCENITLNESKDKEYLFKHRIEIYCKNDLDCKYIAESLSVDEELHPKLTKKIIKYSNNLLTIEIFCNNLKSLRSKINFFYENLTLCFQTIEAFSQ